MAQPIKTALIVDDSRLARVALSKLLANRGIKVDMVGCGEEGLEHLRRHQPDIVFMDYMMPDMDGFEASRRVLADPTCHKPPIVMYTSQDTEEDRLKAAEIGISGFLSKPTTLSALDEVLQAVASGKMRPGASAAAPTPTTTSAPTAAAAKAPAADPTAPLDLQAVEEAARVAARDQSEYVALHYFEQLRDELQSSLQQVRNELGAIAQQVQGVETALAQLPEPQRIDLEELEVRLGKLAEERAESIAGGVARSAAAAAARAQAPQLIADARQAAIDAVELANLPGRLQTLVDEALPRLRRELQTLMQQDLQAALTAALDERAERLESRLLEAAEHAASAELRAHSGSLLLKAALAGIVAGTVTALVIALLL